MSIIGVPVATVWTGPDAPRPIDRPAVADQPDLSRWVAALTVEDRLDLHGRALTQALLGEPVEVISERDGWLEVRLPWQPKGPAGYPGFVRAAHVLEADSAVPPAADAEPIQIARRFLGTGYLWGGLSTSGIDCSGLVHLSHRSAGIVVPRDAADQYAAAVPVAQAEARPGDLYFFARDGGPVSHVGYVSAAPGDQALLLHAPESGSRVEEVPMSPTRAAEMMGIGRFARDATVAG